MSILINKNIPMTMTLAGLEYLGRMAQTVPQNGIIVEIGPLYGSSTWVLANNSHPSVKIYSIDTWEPAPWIEKLKKKYPDCLPFSIEAFKTYTKGCPNVKAIQGWSPDVVADWDRPIDMFFDDASHGNPGFINNLNFFVPKVNPDGIVCGDDYAGGWPDIVREVDTLADTWNTDVEMVGRVWSMMKPNDGKTESVHSLFKENTNPGIVIKTITFSGRVYNTPPIVWSGACHKPDPIKGIKIDWVNGIEGLNLIWKLELSKGGESEWLSLGDFHEVSDGATIRGVTMKLEGKKRNKYQVKYQLGFCMADRSKRKLPNSRLEGGNRALISESDTIAVNAIRAELTNRNV